MEKQTKDMLVVGGLAVGGYLLFSGRSRVDDLPDLVDGEPTMSVGVARTCADTVFAAIYGDGGYFSGQTAEDEEAVIRAMGQPLNDADVALVIREYGVRSGRWALSGDLSLPQACNEYLSASDVQAINDGFAARGITFRF